MAISFHQLLDDCANALSDASSTTWSRANLLVPWCIEAIRSFPILRPRLEDHTVSIMPATFWRLPVDFREIISVEYPVGQTPTSFLKRKNRLDPLFYSDNYFDIDNDYTTGSLYQIYFSFPVPVSSHVYVQYMGSHDIAMTDSETVFLTVRDEYETLLITAVMCRAYRERLSNYFQNPIVMTNTMAYYTDTVLHLEEYYRLQLADVLARLSESRISPRNLVDKYDRVY